ncbi:winged helix DNA-binding domain-containing protein [Saccharothrix sp. S26]|uniref:winged helix DNA-binding domain-containing protein n=1 Tax=Saccharothrix sp. S26 TaxID=2907215 RepID=UPI001F1F6FA9|nr:winged helix DNA-binding domain-containing protein [Saccharothrix sp. S26]MCE6997487.1 winged helix DNA-binding domain-containing protein [Saccharothrix sp. S26]
MTLPEIDDAGRRARLGVRHLLAARAAAVEDVVDAVVGLHATDPATVFLSACARLERPSVAEVEDALYERRTLERLLCMRRTMFAVTAATAPVVHAAAGAAVAANERRKLVAFLAEGAGWDADRLAEVEQDTLEALRRRGAATTVELTRDVPALLDQVVVAAGKPYEARQNVSSRIIRVLAADGRMRRGRPLGTWLGTQFRWEPATPWPELDPDHARAELARRWLAAYGPGTEADLKWWTGWNLGHTRKALAAAGAVEVRLSTGTGYALPDDLEPVPEPRPWAALLPALDPTPMGWQARDWYLPARHRPRLFDTAGNVGPTVWWHGEVVGGWAQRADGEVVWELLRDVGADGEAAIAREADRLASWIGGVRVIPRFRTPLEKELAR